MSETMEATGIPSPPPGFSMDTGSHASAVPTPSSPPPPPPGFTMSAPSTPQNGIPTPPPGFTMGGPSSPTPPPPAGFTMTPPTPQVSGNPGQPTPPAAPTAPLVPPAQMMQGPALEPQAAPYQPPQSLAPDVQAPFASREDEVRQSHLKGLEVNPLSNNPYNIRLPEEKALWREFETKRAELRQKKAEVDNAENEKKQHAQLDEAIKRNLDEFDALQGSVKDTRTWAQVQTDNRDATNPNRFSQYQKDAIEHVARNRRTYVENSTGMKANQYPNQINISADTPAERKAIDNPIDREGNAINQDLRERFAGGTASPTNDNDVTNGLFNVPVKRDQSKKKEPLTIQEKAILYRQTIDAINQAQQLSTRREIEDNRFKTYESRKTLSEMSAGQAKDDSALTAAGIAFRDAFTSSVTDDAKSPLRQAILEGQKGEHPVIAGAAEVVGDLVKPESIAMFAGTGTIGGDVSQSLTRTILSYGTKESTAKIIGGVVGNGTAMALFNMAAGAKARMEEGREATAADLGKEIGNAYAFGVAGAGFGKATAAIGGDKLIEAAAARMGNPIASKIVAEGGKLTKGMVDTGMANLTVEAAAGNVKDANDAAEKFMTGAVMHATMSSKAHFGEIKFAIDDYRRQKAETIKNAGAWNDGANAKDLPWEKIKNNALIDLVARSTLGLKAKGEVTEADITKGYRAAARMAHPDTGGSAEMFKRVELAREYLHAKYVAGNPGAAPVKVPQGQLPAGKAEEAAPAPAAKEAPKAETKEAPKPAPTVDDAIGELNANAPAKMRETAKGLEAIGDAPSKQIAKQLIDHADALEADARASVVAKQVKQEAPSLSDEEAKAVAKVRAEKAAIEPAKAPEEVTTTPPSTKEPTNAIQEQVAKSTLPVNTEPAQARPGDGKGNAQETPVARQGEQVGSKAPAAEGGGEVVRAGDAVGENLQRGDRFTDKDGQEYEVWKNRQGTIEAHPVIDGKPVVNRESGIRFAGTDAASKRNPEDRTDLLNKAATPTAQAPTPPHTYTYQGRKYPVVETVVGGKKATGFVVDDTSNKVATKVKVFDKDGNLGREVWVSKAETKPYKTLPAGTVIQSDRYKAEGNITITGTRPDGSYSASFENTGRTGGIQISDVTKVVGEAEKTPAPPPGYTLAPTTHYPDMDENAARAVHALGGAAKNGLDQKKFDEQFPGMAYPKNPVEEKVQSLKTPQERIAYRESEEYQQGRRSHNDAVDAHEEKLARQAIGSTVYEKSSGKKWTVNGYALDDSGLAVRVSDSEGKRRLLGSVEKFQDFTAIAPQDSATPAPTTPATMATSQGESSGNRPNQTDIPRGQELGQPGGVSSEPATQHPSISPERHAERRAKSVAGIREALKRFRGATLADDGQSLSLTLPSGRKIAWNLTDKPSLDVNPEDIDNFLQSAIAANGGGSVRVGGRTLTIPSTSKEWNQAPEADRKAIMAVFSAHGKYEPKTQSIETTHEVGKHAEIAGEEIFHAMADELSKADPETYRRTMQRYENEDAAFHGDAKSGGFWNSPKSGKAMFKRIREGMAHKPPEVFRAMKKLSPMEKAESKLLGAAMNDGVLMDDAAIESFVNDMGGLHPDVLDGHQIRDENGKVKLRKDGTPMLDAEGVKLEKFVDEDGYSNAVDRMGAAETDRYQQRIINEVTLTKAQKVEMAAEHYMNPSAPPELREAAEKVLGRKVDMGEASAEDNSPIPFAVRKNDLTATPEFKRWFGESKVVDSDGKPMVVYHGTDGDFSQYDDRRSGSTTGNWGWYGKGFYFTDSKLIGSQYTYDRDGGNVMPVYLRIQRPFVIRDEPDHITGASGKEWLVRSAKHHGILSSHESEADATAETKTYTTLENVYVSKNKGGKAPRTLQKDLLSLEGLTASERDAISRQSRKYGDEALKHVFGYSKDSLTMDASRSIRFRELLEKNGYDGVVVEKGGGYREYTAFSPTQIKSATGNSGAFDPANPDIRFAVRKDSPETQLTLAGEREGRETVGGTMAMFGRQETPAPAKTPFDEKLDPKRTAEAYKTASDEQLQESADFYNHQLDPQKNPHAAEYARRFPHHVEIRDVLNAEIESRKAASAPTNAESPEKQQLKAKVFAAKNYGDRVAANLKYIGTPSSDWHAVGVKRMATTTNDAGESVKMPEFDFPQGYTHVKTAFSDRANGDSPLCELCGRDIKNVYHIQNDNTRQTMMVGSECVTHFEDGKSGEALAKAAESSANRQTLAEVESTRRELGRVFGKMERGDRRVAHAEAGPLYEALTKLEGNKRSKKGWGQEATADGPVNAWANKNREEISDTLKKATDLLQSEPGKVAKKSVLEREIREMEHEIKYGRRMQAYPYTQYSITDAERASYEKRIAAIKQELAAIDPPQEAPAAPLPPDSDTMKRLGIYPGNLRAAAEFTKGEPSPAFAAGVKMALLGRDLKTPNMSDAEAKKAANGYETAQAKMSDKQRQFAMGNRRIENPPPADARDARIAKKFSKTESRSMFAVRSLAEIFGLTSDTDRETVGGTPSMFDVWNKTKEPAPAPETKAIEPATRNETYVNGDRAEFTGKSEMISGGKFLEVEMMEGKDKGKMKVVRDPEEVKAETARKQAEYKDQQEQFARLNEPITPKASAEPEGIQDFGEKIGGARKDTAQPVGSRGKVKAQESEQPAWRRRFQISQIAKSSDPSEEGQWTIRDTKNTDWMDRPRQVGGLFASKELAEKAVPLLAVAQKHDVYMSNTPGASGKPTYEIWRKVTDRKRVQVVKESFPTREAALLHMAAHAEEIIETKTGFREEVLVRPETVHRTGTPRRTGPATAKMFANDFGFRGVEFGNWNNQIERQEVMNHAYDAMHDLAEIMGVPPKALSLNGDLALAFGDRGQGLIGAKAHYERDYGVINLTKMSGAGSLAHEWMHGFDHYLGRQDTKAKSTKIQNSDGDMVYPAGTPVTDYASHGFRMNGSGVRPEVQKAYEDLMQTMYTKAVQYVEDSQKAEKFVGGMRDSLKQSLDSIRANLLLGPKELHYQKRNNKPASADQIAAFDRLSARLVDGQDLTTTYRFTKPGDTPSNQRGAMAHRFTNDTLEEISAIMKAVRGRSGFNEGGPLETVRSYMNAYDARIKMLKSANANETKTRKVPTSYAMEAKKIDQGTASDYWSVEHEMIARAFSAYVEDMQAQKGVRGEFLSYGSDNKFYRLFEIAPFPEGAERQALNEKFDNFIHSLKVKESGDGKQAIYAVRRVDENGDLLPPNFKGLGKQKSEPIAPKEPEIKGATGKQERLIERPETEDNETTGIKNAISKRDREQLGLPERNTPEGRSFDEMYDAGKQALESNPHALDTLLNQLRADPERMLNTTYEHGMILKHKVDMENEFQRLRKEVKEAKDDAARQLAYTALDVHRAAVQEFSNLAERTGTATARSLAARKMLSAMDYSLSHMEAMAEASKGSPLTREEQEKVSVHYEEIKASNAKLVEALAEAESRAAEAESKRHFEQLKRQAAETKVKNAERAADPRLKQIADRIAARIEPKAIEAEKRIKERPALDFNDPAAFADLVLVGASEFMREPEPASFAVRPVESAMKAGDNGLAKFAVRKTGEDPAFDAWSKRMIERLGDGVIPHLERAYKETTRAIDHQIDRDSGPTLAPQVKKAVRAHHTGDEITDLVGKMRVRIADGAEGSDLKTYVHKIGLSLVRAGLTDRDTLLDALHKQVQKAIPNITRDQARDILSGYGDFKPLNKEKDVMTLRDIKQQAQKLAQIEALEGGQLPKKTGIEYGEPSDATRALTKQVNELKKQLGIEAVDSETSLRSALDSMKTRTRNLIKDLQTEIDTGQRTVQGKSVPISDAELDALRDQLAKVRKAHEEAFGAKKLTDEQRLDLATKSAARNLNYWNARLESAKKGVFDTENGSTPATSAEIEALKAKTESAKQEYTELLHAANPPKAASEKKAEALQKQIDALTKKIDAKDLSPAKGAKQGPETAAIEALKQQRGVLTKKLAEMRAIDPVLKAKRELDAATNAADEFERRTTASDFTKRGKTPESIDADVLAAKNRRNWAKAAYEAARDADPQYRKQQTEAANVAFRARLARQEADIKDRIARNDYEAAAAKERKHPLDDVSIAAVAEHEKMKNRFKLLQRNYELAKRSMLRRVWDNAVIEPLNISKAIKSAFDLSAPLRQGFFFSFGHPLQSASNFVQSLTAIGYDPSGTKDAWKAGTKELLKYLAFGSDSNARLIDSRIRTRAGHDVGERAKLEITVLGDDLGKHEEAIRSNLSDNIPGIPQSNRAFTTFLNLQRAQMFDLMVQAVPGATKEELRQLAHFTNQATGRGEIKGMERLISAASTILWSPKLLLSRIQLLSAEPLYGGTNRTRRVVAKEYARTLLGLAAFYGLVQIVAMMFRDDDPRKPGVAIDPRSSDFGKIRMGNTRVDPLGGISQLAVLISRVLMGEKKTSSGEVVAIRGEDAPYKGDTTMSTLGRFITTKMSPTISTPIYLWDGRDAVGQPMNTPATVAANTIMPLSVGDLYPVMKEQGIPEGMIVSLLSMMGMGLQNYNADPDKPMVSQLRSGDDSEKDVLRKQLQEEVDEGTRKVSSVKKIERRASMDDREYFLATIPLKSAAKEYASMSEEDKAKYGDRIINRILNSDSMTHSQQEKLMRDSGITPPADLSDRWEYQQLRREATAEAKTLNDWFDRGRAQGLPKPERFDPAKLRRLDALRKKYGKGD